MSVIVKDLLIDQLFSNNEDHHELETPKFFKDVYYETTVISSEDQGNGCVANVVSLKDLDIVLKWSRCPDDYYYLLDEIRYHNVFYLLGLAPKIRQTYRDYYSTYVFMDNLKNLGYYLVADFKLTNEIITDLANAFIVLHDNCLTHGDAHAYNIFYNASLRSVKFIDFSYAKFHKTRDIAFENEYFENDSWLDQGFISKNWYRIKKKYLKIMETRK